MKKYVYVELSVYIGLLEDKICYLSDIETDKTPAITEQLRQVREELELITKA